MTILKILTSSIILTIFLISHTRCQFNFGSGRLYRSEPSFSSSYLRSFPSQRSAFGGYKFSRTTTSASSTVTLTTLSTNPSSALTSVTLSGSSFTSTTPPSPSSSSASGRGERKSDLRQSSLYQRKKPNLSVFKTSKPKSDPFPREGEGEEQVPPPKDLSISPYSLDQEQVLEETTFLAIEELESSTPITDSIFNSLNLPTTLLQEPESSTQPQILIENNFIFTTLVTSEKEQEQATETPYILIESTPVISSQASQALITSGEPLTTETTVVTTSLPTTSTDPGTSFSTIYNNREQESSEPSITKIITPDESTTLDYESLTLVPVLESESREPRRIELDDDSDIGDNVDDELADEIVTVGIAAVVIDQDQFQFQEDYDEEFNTENSADGELAIDFDRQETTVIPDIEAIATTVTSVSTFPSSQSILLKTIMESQDEPATPISSEESILLKKIAEGFELSNGSSDTDLDNAIETVEDPEEFLVNLSAMQDIMIDLLEDSTNISVQNLSKEELAAKLKPIVLEILTSVQSSHSLTMSQRVQHLKQVLIEKSPTDISAHLDTPQFALHARNLFDQLDHLSKITTSTTTSSVSVSTSTETDNVKTTTETPSTQPSASQLPLEVTDISVEQDDFKNVQVRLVAPPTSEEPPSTTAPVIVETQTTSGVNVVTASSFNSEITEPGIVDEDNKIVILGEFSTSRPQRARSPRKVILSSVTYPPLTTQTPITESPFTVTTQSPDVIKREEPVRLVKHISQFEHFPRVDTSQLVASSQTTADPSVIAPSQGASDIVSRSALSPQPGNVSNRDGRILLVNAEDSDSSFNDLTIRYQLPASVSPSAKITPVLKVNQGRQPRRFFN